MKAYAIIGTDGRPQLVMSPENANERLVLDVVLDQPAHGPGKRVEFDIMKANYRERNGGFLKGDDNGEDYILRPVEVASDEI